MVFLLGITGSTSCMRNHWRNGYSARNFQPIEEESTTKNDHSTRNYQLGDEGYTGGIGFRRK
jgi:hypothetical protein